MTSDGDRRARSLCPSGVIGHHRRRRHGRFLQGQTSAQKWTDPARRISNRAEQHRQEPHLTDARRAGVANPGGQRLGTLLQGYEEQSNVNIVRSPSA